MATDYGHTPFNEWQLWERAAYVIGCFGRFASVRVIALEVDRPVDVVRDSLRRAEAEGLAARLPFDRWRLTRKANRVWTPDF